MILGQSHEAWCTCSLLAKLLYNYRNYIQEALRHFSKSHMQFLIERAFDVTEEVRGREELQGTISTLPLDIYI